MVSGTHTQRVSSSLGDPPFFACSLFRSCQMRVTPGTLGALAGARGLCKLSLTLSSRFRAADLSPLEGHRFQPLKQPPCARGHGQASTGRTRS